MNKGKKVNRLDWGKRRDLVKYMVKFSNADHTDRSKYEHIAKLASQELGFNVTRSNVRSADRVLKSYVQKFGQIPFP